MHQIRFRLGLRPRHAGGAYNAPDPLAEFKGPTSKGREGRGRKRGQEGEGSGKKERGEERGRRGGEGKGDRDVRESLGARGREGKGVGKRERENLGGPGPPIIFF